MFQRSLFLHVFYVIAMQVNAMNPIAGLIRKEYSHLREQMQKRCNILSSLVENCVRESLYRPFRVQVARKDHRTIDDAANCSQSSMTTLPCFPLWRSLKDSGNANLARVPESVACSQHV